MSEADQEAVIAAFNQRLGTFRDTIPTLAESGDTSERVIEALRRQLDSLDYQVNQLPSANTDASEDLKSGLELSISDLERRFGELTGSE